MRTKTATVSLILLAALFFWSAALAACQGRGLERLAPTVLDGNPALAFDTASLRQMGPAGMEAMLAQDASGEALDRVCGVRRPNVHLDAESRAFLLRKQGVTDPVQGGRWWIPSSGRSPSTRRSTTTASAPRSC